MLNVKLDIILNQMEVCVKVNVQNNAKFAMSKVVLIVKKELEMKMGFVN